MIENLCRNLERHAAVFQAAPRRRQANQVHGAVDQCRDRAVHTAFHGQDIDQLLPEFSLTLAFAIVVSTVVSLTTPMICAHYMERQPRSRHLACRVVKARCRAWCRYPRTRCARRCWAFRLRWSCLRGHRPDGDALYQDPRVFPDRRQRRDRRDGHPPTSVSVDAQAAAAARGHRDGRPAVAGVGSILAEAEVPVARDQSRHHVHQPQAPAEGEDCLGCDRSPA